MTIVYRNLTPHALSIHIGEGVMLIPPCGTVARVASHDVEAPPVGDIPCVRTVYGDVVDLPTSVTGVVLIVSGMVLAQVADRDDVVAPGQLVRDDAGRPIGCLGLRRR